MQADRRHGGYRKQTPELMPDPMRRPRNGFLIPPCNCRSVALTSGTSGGVIMVDKTGYIQGDVVLQDTNCTGDIIVTASCCLTHMFPDCGHQDVLRIIMRRCATGSNLMYAHALHSKS